MERMSTGTTAEGGFHVGLWQGNKPKSEGPQSPKAVPIPRACGIPRFLSIFINSQKSAKYFRKTP